MEELLITVAKFAGVLLLLAFCGIGFQLIKPKTHENSVKEGAKFGIMLGGIFLVVIVGGLAVAAFAQLFMK